MSENAQAESQPKEEKYNWLDLKEFQTSGLLQEVNRQILHPMGFVLSLVTYPDQDGTGIYELRVQDKRETDTAGVVYPEIEDSHRQRAENIAAHAAIRHEIRKGRYGFIVQPLDGTPQKPKPKGPPVVVES